MKSEASLDLAPPNSTTWPKSFTRGYVFLRDVNSQMFLPRHHEQNGRQISFRS